MRFNEWMKLSMQINEAISSHAAKAAPTLNAAPPYLELNEDISVVFSLIKQIW